MDTINQQETYDIAIREETILNLEHCLERTKHMWQWGLDLWPLEIQHIIKEWNEKKNGKRS